MDTRSIKFKLAILFTVILFVFTGLVILAFNIAINNYLSTKAPVPARPINNSSNQQSVPNYETPEQQQIRAMYSNNLENIQKYSIFSLIPLALISFGLGYILAGMFLRPLNDLNRQIYKLKSENLGTQIVNIPNNEVGTIMKSFNEMSLRLQTSFEQQQRFVQDASHELRTPLTILRTNMETVLDDNNASNGELRDSMEKALLELDEVTELANDLLTLSRPQSNKRITADLNEIVNECVNSFKDLTKIQSVKLLLKRSPTKVSVVINKLEINRAIKNIIDNAIKYSKQSLQPKVIVNLKIDKKNETANIEIVDNGKGIPSSDLKNIFDRFYRVDKSRDRQTGGFGLGLPIAQKIIHEHGGAINVESKPGLTKFTVQLPVIKS